MKKWINLNSETLEILKTIGWEDSRTPELMFHFFIQFMDFEWQLVKRGFSKRKTSDGRVECSWEQFVEEIVQKYSDDAQKIANEHWEFITNQPPGTLRQPDLSLPHFFEFNRSEQEKQENCKRAKRGGNPTDFQEVCKMLCRIRNNLFHGAKNKDSESQTQLRLKEGLNVLRDLRNILSATFPDGYSRPPKAWD